MRPGVLARGIGYIETQATAKQQYASGKDESLDGYLIQISALCFH
jgi:hypothetical protein